MNTCLKLLRELREEVHGIGGCDASDEFARGWDEATDEAIRIIERKLTEVQYEWRQS